MIHDLVEKRWVFAVVIACMPSGCLDLDSVRNENEADLKRALQTPETIESLVEGSFVWHWHVDTDDLPGMAMQVAADGTSSSWGNFGMRDAGSEPRKPFPNSSTYDYASVVEFPWARIYFALQGVRQGINAIDDPAIADRIDRDWKEDAETRVARMKAFGRLIQALSHSNLALIFDQGLVITETTDLVGDPKTLEFKPYTEVWDSAVALYDDFIQLAEGATWEIPTEWVGCNGAWSPQRAIEVARAYRALYAAGLARNPEERAAADWDAIAADAAFALGTGDLAGDYAPNDDCGWAWTGSRWPVLLLPDWGRADLRWIGPADASGAWERWIASALDDRRPFNIDTDDRRVTGGLPSADGKYIQYTGTCPFRSERGLYHCSYYRDYRWDYIYDAQFQTQWPVLTDTAMEFLIAEADYRSGDAASAMALVNRYRVESGNLPPFASPSGVAPGGSRCVPQNADGSCGDLWEALKWEKRIEIYEGYGISSGHFVDDRGWGDLVEGTWEQLPVPASELELLGLPIYTFPKRGSAKLGNNTVPPSIFTAFEGQGDLTIDEQVRMRLGLMEAAAAGLNLESVLRAKGRYER